MPKILDDTVRAIRAKNPGMSERRAYAIATDAAQRSGSLKPGTDKPTKQGVARGQMTPAQRRHTPPRK